MTFIQIVWNKCSSLRYEYSTWYEFQSNEKSSWHVEILHLPTHRYINYRSKHFF